MKKKSEYVQTVVIGGGQSGLASGYHLAQQGLPFLILDSNPFVGDAWRNRWDSLRLFTPARFNGLPGLPFPAPRHSFPSKNQMADYLRSYAQRFQLPVRNGVRVERLSRVANRYLLETTEGRMEADHVIVAMSRYQIPAIPILANALAPHIRQIHSQDYRNPEQLLNGSVLVVGAGNSGADIALDVARAHRVCLSGRDTGHIPFHIESPATRYLIQPLLLRLVFHRLLTIKTPMGRKARADLFAKGGPLIRVKPDHLKTAGVERVPKVVGARNGFPVLEDGKLAEVNNVIWCTGFRPGFSFVDLPVFGQYGMPNQERGAVCGEPGLYFVGLPFIYAFSSAMIHGVDRDAKRVAQTIAQRINRGRSAAGQQPDDNVAASEDPAVTMMLRKL